MSQRGNFGPALVVLVCIGVIGCAGSAIDGGSTDGTTGDDRSYEASVVRMKKLVNGLLGYSSDNDDSMPRRHEWMDVTEPYVRDNAAFVSPIYDGTGNYGYALNEELDGAGVYTFPAGTLAIFDSTVLTRNAAASVTTRPNPPRYGAKNTLSYLDGTVPDAPTPPPPTLLEVSKLRLKQLSLGTIMYAGDYDDVMPPSTWADATFWYVRGAAKYKSPAFDGTPYFGYAMNVGAVGIVMSSVDNPSSFLNLFDSTNLQWNAVASPNTLPNPGRYEGKNTFSFLDGHAATD
jgi:hypothetical protein